MLERIKTLLLLAALVACAGCSSKWWPAPGFLDGWNNNATNAPKSDGYSIMRDGRPEPF
jgi:hypothetical protein